MKRLLVLNYEFPPLGGGASPVSYELAKRLSETGEYDIDVVTMGYKALPGYEEINEHLRVHRVKCLRSKKEICHPWEQATYLVSGYYKCRELLQKEAFNICHCHFIIPTGILALRLKKEFGLEYVITAHGSDVLGYNKRFKLLYPFLIGKWKKILDGAKNITSPSNFLKQEILKQYVQFNEENIKVIPNGIDTNKFNPREKKNYIFSSGRLVSTKGFQHLIQAVSDEDLGYEVHIAGDGPMMAELKVLARKSKTKVILHGWMDNSSKQYKDLLEQASIYVLVSEKENASISLLEGMSTGGAIISSNNTGCFETVADTALLVEYGNVLKLKEGLFRLITHEDTMIGYQKASRSRAVELYDWLVVSRIYQEILS